MSNIKFRGREIYTNKWVYGGISSNFSESKFWINTFDIDGFSKQIEVDKHSIGQWIGLLDSNNNEVYVGDILLYANKYKYLVEFCRWEDNFGRTYFGIHLKGIGQPFQGLQVNESFFNLNGQIVLYYPSRNDTQEAKENLLLEIVGTKYENDELMYSVAQHSI